MVAELKLSQDVRNEYISEHPKNLMIFLVEEAKKKNEHYQLKKRLMLKNVN